MTTATIPQTDFKRPVVYALLSLLQQAGEEGMLAGTLTRAFPEPEDTSRRNRLVNANMAKLMESGKVRHGVMKEHGPYYHGTPQWRWFITPAGEAWLGRGPRGLIGEERKAYLDDLRRLAAENAARRKALIHQAISEGYGPSTVPCRRRDKVIELRKERLSLEEIGTVFGISRERVRQVEADLRPTICRCSLHPHIVSAPPRLGWPKYARLPQPGTLGEVYLSWAQEALADDERPVP